MKRRNFIRNTSAFIAPLFLGGFRLDALSRHHFISRMMEGSGNSDGKVLVIIQLFGGNDGLNTVVPVADHRNYFHARKNLAIDIKKILPLDGFPGVGFHPALKGMQKLFNERKLAIVQSVGYPQPDFSHFRSSDIWMSGSDSNQSLSTGWAGRYLYTGYPAYPEGFPSEAAPDPLAVQIGNATSFVLQGERAPMGVNIVDPSNVYELNEGFTCTQSNVNAQEQLSFIRTMARQSQSYSKVIRKAAEPSIIQAEYPDGNALAQQLKIVAQLIKGGLGTKVYMVSFDGFDTHAQQVTAGDTSVGRHADLLRTVGDAVLAFQRDIEFLGIDDRITTMTFSEFGRRIVSNDSLGTDHGTAAPLFIFGSKVRGGIYGDNPTVPSSPGPDDNIDMQTDFRKIYSTILRNWMNVEQADLTKILLRDYGTLPFL